MTKYTALILIVLFMTRCSKSSNSLNTGVYEEVSPVAGQTTLQFIDSSKIIINGAQLNDAAVIGKKTYGYRINGHSIFIFPMPATASDTIGFYFNSSGNTIDMSSCPPGVPCFASAKSYVFSK